MPWVLQKNLSLSGQTPRGHPGWGLLPVHATKPAYQHIRYTTLSSSSCSIGEGPGSPNIKDDDGNSKLLSIPALVQEASSSSNISCTNGSKGGGHYKSSAGRASPSPAGVRPVGAVWGLLTYRPCRCRRCICRLHTLWHRILEVLLVKVSFSGAKVIQCFCLMGLV